LQVEQAITGIVQLGAGVKVVVRGPRMVRAEREREDILEVVTVMNE
jgi:hypothetical protein